MKNESMVICIVIRNMLCVIIITLITNSIGLSEEIKHAQLDLSRIVNPGEDDPRECKPIVAADILDVSGPYYVCDDICEIKVNELVMARGAYIFAPSPCAKFIIRAEKAEFYGNNFIGADRTLRTAEGIVHGADGVEMVIDIKEAYLRFQLIDNLQFDEQSIVVEKYIGYTPRGTLAYHWVQAVAPQEMVEDYGVIIYSRGAKGKKGSTGPKGANATRKHCGAGSGSGNEAGQGGQGGSGGMGGRGGDIGGTFSIDPSSRDAISVFDVLKLSVGGAGGDGGDGGPGGDGVGGHRCFPAGRRSGFPRGADGPVGPRGGVGASGETTLSVSIK